MVILSTLVVSLRVGAICCGFVSVSGIHCGISVLPTSRASGSPLGLGKGFGQGLFAGARLTSTCWRERNHQTPRDGHRNLPGAHRPFSLGDLNVGTHPDRVRPSGALPTSSRGVSDAVDRFNDHPRCVKTFNEVPTTAQCHSARARCEEGVDELVATAWQQGTP